VAANGLVNYTGGGFNVTAGDTLTLNGGMNWATTNAISGPGAITLPTGQTLALTVGGDHALSGQCHRQQQRYGDDGDRRRSRSC
jgi:hypothetical protein